MSAISPESTAIGNAFGYCSSNARLSLHGWHAEIDCASAQNVTSRLSSSFSLAPDDYYQLDSVTSFSASENDEDSLDWPAEKTRGADSHAKLPSMLRQSDSQQAMLQALPWVTCLPAKC